MDQQMGTSAPPHSVDAERAVLGTVLRDPSSLNQVSDKLQAEHFFVDVHRFVFKAIIELDALNEPTDIVSVSDKLVRSGYSASEYSGPSFLIELTERAPVSQNVDYYADLVRDYFYLRQIITACQQTMSKAMACSGRAAGFIEEVEKEFLSIANEQDRKGGLVPHVEVLNSTIIELEAKLAMEGALAGVPSGFNDLDQLTGGWNKSDLIIIAARPGMGKTAFMLNCAMNAVKAGVPTAMFTLEMSRNQLMQRLLASEARVDSQSLRKGETTEDGRNRLMQGARVIATLPAQLGIDETSGISLVELRSRCRRFKKEYGLGLIMIDYLQLMVSSTTKKNDSREREIAEISGGLKGLAKELQVPVIAAAQLNREADKRVDKRPKISDLRESGSIEMDADQILFLYRDEYYNKNSEDVGKAEVILGKNRHGSVETVMLAYQSAFVSFHNLMKN